MNEELPVTMPSTPGGSPASWHAEARQRVVRGASTAGLTITEQPAASAGAIFREDRSAGKFQGEKAATGPTGCRMTRSRWSRLWPSITRP